MQSLAVAEAYFDRIREVWHSSEHATVGGDRVADNVDADLDGINIESKYCYQPHEVDLLRHIRWDTESPGRRKTGVEEHGIGKGQGEVGKREGE